MKNTNVIELVSNLGHIVSANDDVINNYEIFIQTVFYHGTSKENKQKGLYNKQKTNNSISIPPDLLLWKQLSVVLLAALYR